MIVDKDRIYKMALEKWGIDSQLFMAIEEMSELMKEISKARRQGDNYKISDMAEEITDVLIMIDQLIVIFNIDQDSLRITKKIKLSRLKALLESEN